MLLPQTQTRQERAAEIEPTEISDTEITFQDTCVYILDLRTHFKPTETFQYTHFTSCHPPGIKKGFFKSKALRLLRTKSSKATFNLEKTLHSSNTDYAAELGYPDNLLENILLEIKFVTEYRPSVPNLKWHLIENQPLLREIYNEPPLLSKQKTGGLWKMYSLEQSFEGQSFLILTNGSLVWPANHCISVLPFDHEELVLRSLKASPLIKLF